jgi:hypothetical protein
VPSVESPDELGKWRTRWATGCSTDLAAAGFAVSGCGRFFRTIRQRAEHESRVDAVVEFRITGGQDGRIDRYQLALIDGQGRTPRRDAPGPALTLELEPAVRVRLVG